MNSYLTFRKVHRVLVLVMIGSTLLMTITGLIMKYPAITNVVSFDLGFIRKLHNLTSPFFSIVLLLMMLSGTVMYFYPIIARRKKTNDR
jgi:hypothetical protein